jgi:hypothetical protein
MKSAGFTDPDKWNAVASRFVVSHPFERKKEVERMGHEGFLFSRLPL